MAERKMVEIPPIRDLVDAYDAIAQIREDLEKLPVPGARKYLAYALDDIRRALPEDEQ